MGVEQVAQTAKTSGQQAAASSKSALAQEGLQKAREGMQSGSYAFEGMDAPEGAEAGDRIAPGKQVGKDGKIENTATREGIEAAANVASIFIGGAPAAAKGAAGGAAKSAATTAAKEGAKTAAQEGAKTAAKEGAKQAAQQGAKEAAGSAAKEGAKGAAKQGAGSAAKGFGAGNKGALGGGGKMNAASMGMQQVMDMPGVKDAVTKAYGEIDKLAGTAADELEKVPGVKKVAEDNVDLSKSVNAVFNAYGNAVSGNYDQAAKDAKKAIKHGAKYTAKVLLRTLLMIFLPLLLLILIVVVIIGAIEEGFVALTENAVAGTAASIVDSSLYDAINGNETVKAVVNSIPDFDSLPQGRQWFIIIAAQAIGQPYYGGGRPTAANLEGIHNGVDSGGFLEWLVWAVSLSDPGYLPGSSLESNPLFEEINQSDLLPGDIGVDEDNIGIYIGENDWIFVSPEGGIIRSEYNGFTRYFRYKNFGSGGGRVLPSIDPGQSTEVRERVLTIAKQLSDMHIPYNVHFPDNKAKSLDINGNGWFTPMDTFTTADLNTTSKVANKLHGMDCCSFAGYVYSVAINDSKYFGMCSYLVTNAVPPGFTEISYSNVQPGDLIAFESKSTGKGGHMAIFISSNGTTMQTYESGGWGSRYYVYDSSSNSFSPYTGSGTPSGQYINNSGVGTQQTPYAVNSDKYNYRFYRYTEGTTVSPTSSDTYDGSKSSGSCQTKINQLYPNGVPSTKDGLAAYEVLTTVAITKKDGTKSTKQIYLHKNIANDVAKALQEAQDGGFKVYDVQSSRDWSRCISETSGATCGLKMSQHCYGLAVDINIAENPYEATNPYADSEYAINHDTAVYKAFKSIGWGWGGDWKQSRKDYMHFSYMGT